MVYKYRVTLAGIKGFFRVYLVNGDNSLYTFHKQLRADLEFPMDQPILFKAFDEDASVVARYALMDIGYGAVDAIKISSTVKAGITSFVYFYDITSRKSVIITLEGEDKESDVTAPTLAESKGPVPLEFENGYVAFEDLPDDRRKLPGEASGLDDDDEDLDDEEDDEEDSDREEEDIIYDESE